MSFSSDTLGAARRESLLDPQNERAKIAARLENKRTETFTYSYHLEYSTSIHKSYVIHGKDPEDLVRRLYNFLQMDGEYLILPALVYETKHGRSVSVQSCIGIAVSVTGKEEIDPKSSFTVGEAGRYVYFVGERRVRNSA